MRRQRSGFFTRHDNGRKAQRFRVQLLETLDARIVMAADATAVFQDLANSTVHSNGSLIGPSSASIRTNTNDIVDLTDKELPPELQRMINGALRFRSMSVDQSGTAQHLNREAGKSNLVQDKLMRSPFAMPLDLNSAPRTVSNNSSLDNSSKQATALANPTIQSLSAIARRTAEGLKAKAGSTVESRQASPAVHATASPVQWVGAFCDASGLEVHPPSSQLTQKFPAAEGEGEEPGYLESLVPEVEFPQLEFTEYTGSLDNFVPSQQTSISSITTFGAFTAASLANPNFTLPGVNWVSQIDQTWTSSTEWSLTETFIISFRLSDSDSGTDSESTTNRELLSELEEELPDESEQDLELEIDTETDSTASRVGFYILVFNASRGVSSPSAAGVKWSFQEDYSDSVVLEIEQTVDVGYMARSKSPATLTLPKKC